MLNEEVARTLESDGQKIIKTWREMIKAVLAESESVIRNVLANVITAN